MASGLRGRGDVLAQLVTLAGSGEITPASADFDPGGLWTRPGAVLIEPDFQIQKKEFKMDEETLKTMIEDLKEIRDINAWRRMAIRRMQNQIRMHQDQLEAAAEEACSIVGIPSDEPWEIADKVRSIALEGKFVDPIMREILDGGE